MTRQLLKVSTDDHMADLLELLRAAQISGAPVVSQDQLVGIISLEDLIRAVTDHDLDAQLSKYTSQQVITVNAFDPAVEALEMFCKARVGRLPVVDEQGMLVGRITKGDITRGVLLALQKDYQEEEVQIATVPATCSKTSIRTALALSCATASKPGISPRAAPPAPSNAPCCGWAPAPRSPGAAGLRSTKPR